MGIKKNKKFMKKWTGERLESFIQNKNTLEHLHRYAIAQKYTNGKIVLDIASGEGYGSNLLASNAKKVVGVDIAKEVVDSANKKYIKNNLVFIEGSTDLIPCEDSCFDVVVSFETLEHHDKHQQMLLEIKRVLKSDGILIISTPDKLYYTDKCNYKNPFHIKELYLNEFQNLLSLHFTGINYFTQKCILNSIVIPLNDGIYKFEEYTGDFNELEKVEKLEYVYIIAICSNSDLKILNNISVFQSAEITKSFELSIINSVKQSIRYRIGDCFIRPLKRIKTFFK